MMNRNRTICAVAAFLLFLGLTRGGFVYSQTVRFAERAKTPDASKELENSPARLPGKNADSEQDARGVLVAEAKPGAEKSAEKSERKTVGADNADAADENGVENVAKNDDENDDENDDAEKSANEKKSSASKNKLSDDTPIVGRKRVVVRVAALDPDRVNAEDSTEQTEIVGREIADYRTISGQGKYCMEDDRGVIRAIPGDAIVSIEDAPDTTLAELRKTLCEELLAEFGEGFSTKTSEHYVFVSDASEGYVEWGMRLFESLADGFRRYASQNKFVLTERVEPMVVVIFSTQQDFVRYAAKETPSPDKIAAYYNMETNRVVLYDLSETEGTRAALNKRRRTFLETKEFLSRPNAAFNVATIVHEATHQIAYNEGLFQRTGPFALWTVEGLSLLFETPNGKASQGGWGYRSPFPTNKRQLAYFRNFVSRTTQKDAIRDLVRQDKFMVDLEGSYATSWALFYYFYKKRPKELAGYVQEIAKRPPYTTYSPEDRVADFEKYFGDDWEKLQDSLLRFAKRL